MTKISLVQLITNLNVILYLSTCRPVYISVLILRGNKMPTRCNRGFYCRSYFCSTRFGHHYAHHQELKSIIQWLLPVVFLAVVFKLLVWCGAECYVSGLQDAAVSCNLKITARNTTGSNHCIILLSS